MSEEMKEKFIQAIKSQKKIRVTFFSKEDNEQVTRVCAPMDIGPSRRAKDKSDRFHMWNYEGKEKPHIVSKLLPQVTHLEILEEGFDSAEFVKWNAMWEPQLILECYDCRRKVDLDEEDIHVIWGGARVLCDECYDETKEYEPFMEDE